MDGDGYRGKDTRPHTCVHTNRIPVTKKSYYDLVRFGHGDLAHFVNLEHFRYSAAFKCEV
jgi:hypothetical protein